MSPKLTLLQLAYLKTFQPQPETMKGEIFGASFVFPSSSETFCWSNYSDLTQPHPKWWFSKGYLLISGKSRLQTPLRGLFYIYLFIFSDKLRLSNGKAFKR